ncbi:MAG: hypothetical protein EOO52_01375 [Gammaproteobacteria bacterium]|nr:MAG: hypothetical protein EOO52_01375 [Gammaproteobacteria bacterium]
MNKNAGIFKRNGLLITFLLLMIVSLIGQAYTGYEEDQQERYEKHLALLTFGQYLASGHFLQATFENWESEFLQMGLYVVLTVFLYQQGSAESKSLDEPEDVDREPTAHENAPWPVKKGGIYLSVYKNSLSLAFLILFGVSFLIHAYGTMQQINEEEHKALTLMQTFMENRFWFESFQNWQSEFLSVAAIVFFSIFLRQKGSPESKRVDSAHSDTGK